MIKLRYTGTYKDGGSESFKDNRGNEYWLDNSIGTKTPGKLFKGNINNNNPQLAEGEYELIYQSERKNSKIIKQK